MVLKLRGNATFTQTIVSGLFNNLNSEDFLISKLDLNKNADRKNLGWQGVAYYKHKFKTKSGILVLILFIMIMIGQRMKINIQK